MTQVWAIFHHNVLNPNVSRAISPMNDTHKKKSSYKCKMEKKAWAPGKRCFSSKTVR